MVKALPFIRQPDGLAREASDVSAANWRKASGERRVTCHQLIGDIKRVKKYCIFRES